MQLVSQDELVKLLRTLLLGKDLSVMTPKIIRQMVIERLKEKAGDDMKALKVAIRSALNVVLSEPADEIEQTQQPKKSAISSSSTPEKNEANSKKELNGQEYQNEPQSTKDEAIKSDNVGSGELADDEKDEEEEDVDFGMDESEDENPKKRSSKKRSRPPASSTESKSRPSPKVANASVRNRSMRSEKYLGKLRRLAKQLGIPIPPSRYRGSSLEEKCANVLAFFASKGFDMDDPTRMTRDQISRHRRRLEQQKELDGLDVSNIIEETGRSKRRRILTPAPVEQELPSDFSGPASSGKSESEGEEYNASGASD